MNNLSEILEDTYKYEYGKLRPQGYMIMTSDVESLYTKIDEFNKNLPLLKEDISNVLILNVLPENGLKETFHHWGSLIYGKEFKANKTAYEIMEYQIHSKLKELEIRMIIIKDIHNFKDKVKRNNLIFMNYIKNISNKYNIPSILCGDLNSNKLLLDDQLLSRYIPLKIIQN